MDGDDTEEAAKMGKVRTGADVEAGEDARDEGLHPQEVDAYWLQRRVAAAFGDIDADTSQRLAEEVLSTLQVGCLPSVSSGLRACFRCCLTHCVPMFAAYPVELSIAARVATEHPVRSTCSRCNHHSRAQRGTCRCRPL